ncbi:MAG TPA: LamB/YcsF family protein, partial [Flavobacteriaceae bacterium]|nr:LamB/YcsF family protein [Flavobacteriaceae bacterium]
MFFNNDEMEIDLNCDLGEGGKSDTLIMPLISSCNIACGGHYGNEKSIAETLDLAAEYKVNIGAHPSYPDKKNFGRKPIDISLKTLEESLIHQIQLLCQQAKKQKLRPKHVKPHGRLYHDLISNEEKAEMFVNLVWEINPRFILF